MTNIELRGKPRVIFLFLFLFVFCCGCICIEAADDLLFDLRQALDGARPARAAAKKAGTVTPSIPAPASGSGSRRPSACLPT